MLIKLKTDQEIYALVAQLVEQLICNHNPPNYLTRTCYSSNKYYHHLSKKDSVIFIIDIPTVCRQIAIYEKWCLEKKAKQVDDVTKKERFDVTSELPLKISK